MRFTAVLGLGFAAALAATPAFAFQEQQVGGSDAAPAAAAPAAGADVQSKDLGLTLPPASTDSTAGTEVRIPGLGKLGVLPKMDFGLELLYGASDTKQPDAVREDPAGDDLMIRGTVKHNF